MRETWRDVEENKILDCLLLFMRDDDKKENKTVKIMQTLLKKSPHIVTKIAQELNDAIQHGSLDLHDIPRIIIAIKNIYNLHVESFHFLENGLEFIETLLILLIHEEILPIEENKRDMYIIMIQSCLHLLESTLASKSFCCLL
jgi:hypothetical protein